MLRRPPRSTRTDTLFPYTTLFRSNGRIGRAIAEKALAQNLAAPTLTALSETIHRHRKAYYAALQLGSQSNDINAWLTWFADIVIEAQARTIPRIRFLIDKKIGRAPCRERVGQNVEIRESGR